MPSYSTDPPKGLRGPYAVRAEATAPQSSPAPPPPTITTYTLGAAQVKAYTRRRGEAVDWTLINRSTAEIYVRTAENGDYIPVSRRDYASCINWVGDLILSASAANSAVTLTLQIHGSPWDAMGVNL